MTPEERKIYFASGRRMKELGDQMEPLRQKLRELEHIWDHHWIKRQKLINGKKNIYKVIPE